MSAWDDYDALVEMLSSFEVHAKLTGIDGMWDCEIKIIVNPNDRDRADQSVAFFTMGGLDGEQALAKCVAQVRQNLKGAFALRRSLPDNLRRWDDEP